MQNTWDSQTETTHAAADQQEERIPMDVNVKENWETLYGLTRLCSEMQPWNTIPEGIPFVYIQKDTGREIIFSMLGSEYPFCGFAVYQSWIDFCAARHRMRGQNKKREPLFLLQNATIGKWGCRSDVSKENYAVLKELDLRGHGDGTWLFFERYRVGYAPASLTDTDVEALADSMGNLQMMLRAYFEHGGMQELKPGTMMIRTYDPKSKLFHTGVAPMLPLIKPDYPVFTVSDNKNLRQLACLPTSQYSLEIDWSYLPMPLKNGTEVFIPRLLIGANTDGNVLITNYVLADMDQANGVLNTLAKVFLEHGKPAEIRITDRELEGILSDFCKKVSVSLRFSKTLPSVNRFRNAFLKDLRFNSD